MFCKQKDKGKGNNFSFLNNDCVHYYLQFLLAWFILHVFDDGAKTFVVILMSVVANLPLNCLSSINPDFLKKCLNSGYS